MRAWLTSALGGLALLGALRALAPWLGFSLRIGAPSLAVAAGLGAPGITALLALRAVFRIG